MCVCHGPRGPDRGKKLFGPLIVLWAFVGPGRIEHVTGTGRRKKTFQAAQNFVGFFGTRRVRACDRDRELSRKQLLQQ